VLLNLTRPLAFFDLETTGISVGADRIVEISILKLNPDGTKEILTRRINPVIPIPAQATAIHGISNEDVKNEPTFAELAHSLNNFLEGCDLAGYNSNRFDIPLLVEEFLRSDIDFEVKGRKMIDVQNIFHKKEQRTLSAALKFYCDKIHNMAHSAEADTIATHEILEAQLDKYPDLKNDTSFLHEYSTQTSNVDLAGRIVYNSQGVEVFNFGKHTGKAVETILKTVSTFINSGLSITTG